MGESNPFTHKPLELQLQETQCLILAREHHYTSGTDMQIKHHTPFEHIIYQYLLISTMKNADYEFTAEGRVGGGVIKRP